MRRIIRFANNLEEYSLGLSLLALALFACVQVFTRYVLNYSFAWFEELSQYACVFLTFLGASLGIKYGTHFTMSAVVDRLPRNMIRFVNALVYLICALFFVVVAYYGTKHCIKHYNFGNLSAALRLPMFVPYLPIPIFSAIMAVRCLMIAAFNIFGTRDGEPVRVTTDRPAS
jgi:C4-dicarboxylate transporter DctQ subunit